MNAETPGGWVRAETVAFVDTGDRVTLLALDRLDKFGARVLMGPSASIWRAVSSASSLEEIAWTIAQEFGTDVVTVMEDVLNFLRDLLDQGLVVVDD
jgi:hypothetical protein